MDELVGKAFGPYTIVEKIAEGGMAVVYKGYQESLNRYVAIKVLRGELIHNPDFVTRFRREALAVAKLSHPNILHVYDANVANGWYYIVMDYVDGGSLRDQIEQGPLDMEDAIHITGQVADALDYAHRQGLIHRDVKPANILITREGRPLLTDFGIARALDESTHLTRTGTSIGTPAYMAPEQAQGQRGDGRTDIYALGVVLYEMLSGLVPFSAPTPVATLYKQVNEPPPPLRQVNVRVPGWLEAAIGKALAKRPQARYQHASEFAEVLRQRRAPGKTKSRTLLRSRTPAPATRLTGAAARQQPSRNWIPILLGAAILLLVIVLGGGAFLFLGNPGSDAIPTSVVVAATATAAPTETQTPKPTRLLTDTPTPAPSNPLDTPTPVVLVVTATSAPTTRPTSTLPPALTPSATQAQLTATTAATRATQPGMIADFESFGSWRRGDEANGTFTQSRTQSHQGTYAGKLAYDFDTSDNDYVVFEQLRSIGGQPKYITAWVYGDESGHFLNVWIKDKGGQVWQVPLGRIEHTGWQQMIGQIDTAQDWPWTHISGPDNGIVDYPIAFQAFVLDDNPDRFSGSGTLYLDDLRAETQIASTLGGSSGATSTPAPTSGASAPPPSNSSQSGRIAFTVYNSGIGSYTLYTVKPDGSGLHAVADYVHHPDISSNGKRIVVDGVGGSKNDL